MYEGFWFYLNKLVGPLSANEDARRREFILNVILIGSLSLALVATLHILVDKIQMGSTYEGSQPGLTFIFFLLFLALYFASRAKFAKEASYILTGVYFAGATYTAYLWGSDVPQALLVYAVVIVIAGILVSTRFAFLVTLAVFVSLVVIAWLQITGIISVDRYWVNPETPDMADAITASVTLVVIALVSWLSNREIDKSLFRARTSESALKEERGHLEEKVEERTRELKKAQLEKMFGLYRFAEFGKLASGLIHDFVSSLNVVSLNLEELGHHKKGTLLEAADIQKMIRRAMSGTHQLERFTVAARHQIQEQSVLKVFSVSDEIEQVVQILTAKAREEKVKLRVVKKGDDKLYGDPVKLNQLVTNLVSNAINAYQETPANGRRREVYICLQSRGGTLTITVQDWACGISQANLGKIFEPLFTTREDKGGTGLGLEICREAVEKGFGGSISVQSKLGKGTKFTVALPFEQGSRKENARG